MPNNSKYLTFLKEKLIKSSKSEQTILTDLRKRLEVI